jgi:XRE family aerobic/anaerobic benzoate catabolism transcriptional regulator
MPHDELLAGLGARIRALRAARDWSQRDLCREAGVSPRFLVQVEQGTGNLSLGRLADLAAALGVSPVALLCGLGPVADELDRIASAAAGMGARERRRLRLKLERSERLKIALVGIRGAGKTAVGQRMAEEAGCPFVELDRRVEAAAGMALREVFEYDGADRYRALTREALEEVLAEPGPAMIEAGGSLVSDPEAWALLRARARVVWLRASPAELLRRVRAQGDLRPMSGWGDPLGEIQAILARREPGYAQADLAVETEGRTLEEVARAITAGLQPALAAV